MADGSRTSVGIIQEVAYGVVPANPAFADVRNTGVTLGLSKDTLQSGEIRADRQIADFRHGTRKVGGDISMELSYGTFDAILEALLGGMWQADTPAVGTDRLIAGTTRRSFVIERFFADILAADKPYHRFTGCEFNNMQLQIAANAMITGTFGVVGKDMATDAAIVAGATYGAASTTSPLDSFSGSLIEGGAPIAVITEMQLSLDNGLNPRYVVGSKTSERPSIGRSNVTGQVTAFFENSDMLDKFINETESSIELDLPDAAGNAYKITLPRVKYNGGQPDTKGEGSITLAMPFQALLDSVTGTNIIIDRTPA